MVRRRQARVRSEAKIGVGERRSLVRDAEVVQHRAKLVSKILSVVSGG
jgi:hypothetical protein